MRKPPVIPPRRPYATDLTDAEWQLLAPLIPAPKPGGRPPLHDRREGRQKRGGSARTSECETPGAMLASERPAEFIASREASPDFAAQVAEQCERLLASLSEEDLKAIAVWKATRTQSLHLSLGTNPFC